MQGTQLELELQCAIADPPQANLEQLWHSLEVALQPLTQEQQLHVAGEAISQIAEVVYVRAQQILESLERSYASDSLEIEPGPTLNREALAPYIRQSCTVNLDTVVIEPLPRHREPRIQSVVNEWDKAALLSFVDELEREVEQTQQVQSLAHDEPILQWVEVIRAFLSQQPLGQAVSFVELVRSLSLPKVAVWLGLLHGQGWQLQQKGEFYDGLGILISSTNL
jgi:hypothetical protein